MMWDLVAGWVIVSLSIPFVAAGLGRRQKLPATPSAQYADGFVAELSGSGIAASSWNGNHHARPEPDNPVISVVRATGPRPQKPIERDASHPNGRSFLVEGSSSVDQDNRATERHHLFIVP